MKDKIKFKLWMKDKKERHFLLGNQWTNEGISQAQLRSKSCRITEIWSQIFPLLSFDYSTVSGGSSPWRMIVEKVSFCNHLCSYGHQKYILYTLKVFLLITKRKKMGVKIITRWGNYKGSGKLKSCFSLVVWYLSLFCSPNSSYA